MPRVLLVSQPTDGGAYRHVRDLVATLPSHGYEPVVCAPFGPGQGAELGCEIVPLAMERRVGRADAGAVARFARLVRRVRPDLVHAHSSKAGALARLARPANPRVPVLYTPHGYAHAGHFERPAESRAYRLAEMLMTPMTSRVICVCEAERRLAAGVGPASRTRVVHNGIAPAGPGPTNPRVAELRAAGGPVVALVTLLRPGKGVETLLDAFARVAGEHPGARLAIAGDGLERGALEARARQRGIAGAVHFLGLTRDAEEVLRGADLFVSPSWAESFPYVVLEAMALGLPVVATEVGGVAEAVEDGRTGLLVPPRDPEALAAAISRLISEPARADDMGERGRRRVALRFSRDHMAGAIAAVYREVLPGGTTV